MYVNLLLNFLDLSANNLSGLSELKLPNLQVLDISYNRNISIEINFSQQFPNLETLNVSGTINVKFDVLQKISENVTTLQSLIMADGFDDVSLIGMEEFQNVTFLNISHSRKCREINGLLRLFPSLKVSFLLFYPLFLSS